MLTPASTDASGMALVHFEEQDNRQGVVETHYPSRVLGYLHIDGKQEAAIQCSSKPIDWNTVERQFIVPIKLGTDFNISFVTVPIDALVHPFIFALGRNELRHCAEIIFRRINLFTGGETFHDVWRAVAEPLVADLDDDAIIGLQSVDGIRNGHAIGTRELPVGRIAHQLAFDQRAFHAATFKDRDDASRPVGDVADGDWCAKITAGFIHKFEFGFDHAGRSFCQLGNGERGRGQGGGAEPDDRRPSVDFH